MVLFSYLTIALLALGGALFSFRLAEAQDVMVTAQIGQVAVGPTSVTEERDDNDDDDDESEKAVEKEFLPSLTVLPSNTSGILFSQADGKFTFSSARLAFEGHTNIRNADIILIFRYGDFSLRSNVTADGDGNWHVQLQQPFPDGTFSLSVRAEYPEHAEIHAETTLVFSVLNAAPIPVPEWQETFGNSATPALFDVRAKVLRNSLVIPPGEDVLADIRLINFGDPASIIDTEVEYLILNEANEVVIRQKETVAVSTQLRYLKTFYTHPEIPEGKYRLIVRVPSRNMMAESIAEFTIRGEGVLGISPIGRIDYTTIYITLVFILFLFILLSYFEFVRFLTLRQRIRMVSEKNLQAFL